MKLVIQRVNEARVDIEDKIFSSIDAGMLVLVGIEKLDQELHIDKAIDKLLKLRMFSDSEGKSNLSIQDIHGDILLVSQFTLSSDLSRGNRPSFDNAMKPKEAKELIDLMIQRLKKSGLRIESGDFGSDMKVSLVNDGPVTYCLEFQ